jgi:hypothetical protein
MVEAGALHRIHRWVYAVGHARLSVYAKAMAAVLACGPGAVLSHKSAAWLWNLGRDGRSRFDVTVPGRRLPSRPGIEVHHTSSLHPEDHGTSDGILVTSLARTLLDMAETEGERTVRRAWEQAERLHLLDLDAVNGLAERSRGRRGLKPLLALIANGSGPVHDIRSDIERRLPELCRENDLPEPAMNVVVAGRCVDAYWADAKLVGQIDPYLYHHTRVDFERDLRRDLDVREAGVEVVRIPERVEAALPALRRALG